MKPKQLLSGLLIGIASICNAQTTSIQGSNVTAFGYSAGTVAIGSAFFGFESGKVSNTGTARNSFFGQYSGTANSLGSDNVFFGYQAGTASIKGNRNAFFGSQSAATNVNGNDNTAVGYLSGNGLTNGRENVFIGSGTGFGGTSATANTFIGYKAGSVSNGSGNIFIGNRAGSNASGDNLLFVDNSSTSTPLIWGNFSDNHLKFNAVKVGIDMGTTAFPTNAGSLDVSAYKLFVNGGILAKEVRVATTWADYVFEDNYKLPTLDEVEHFIEKNGHLPNVPSAKQVETEGIEVGEMAKIQQEKIEELTLYAIEQNKQLSAQEKQLKEQAEKIDKLEKMVEQLMDKQ